MRTMSMPPQQTFSGREHDGHSAMARLAIVSTHPVQYNAPLFKRLAVTSGMDIKVFYSWEGTSNQEDPEFGRAISWDLPLLDGYDWELIPNESSDPGTHHFTGLRNPEMTSRIADWNPDFILVYGWAWWTHLLVMRRFKGRIPLLFRGDSTRDSFNGPPWKRWLRWPSLIWIYRHIDLALSPGQKNRSYLHMAGVKDNKIAYMPHTIETDRFSDSSLQEAADKEREALGIPSDAVVFGFAGKLVPRKECGMLICAFRNLKAKAGQRPHLLIIGEGPLRQSLVTAACGDPNIHFVGFKNQTEMPKTYRIADVVVVPSSIETWGLVVNEALASGRPVIVSDHVGAAPDLVARRRYGCVVAVGDGFALNEAMESWASSRTEVRALGKLAEQEAAAFSIDAGVRCLLEAVSSRHLPSRSVK